MPNLRFNLWEGGTYYKKIEDLPTADITFIATPEDRIQEACEKLAKNPQLKCGGVVSHFSGGHTAEILNKVRIKNCFVASHHPMKSFANPQISVEEFKGTYIAIEGDKKAISILYPLFKKIGAIPFQINSEKKALYHAGSVFGSNYLITLAEQSLTCMQEAGIEKDLALEMIIHLMNSSLSNLEKTFSTQRALTGPIRRGDVCTLKRHLGALENEDKRKLYSILGKATIELTKHSKEKKKMMEEVLDCK